MDREDQRDRHIENCGTCYSDHESRLADIERRLGVVESTVHTFDTTLRRFGGLLRKIERKVFNGFEAKIKSLTLKVDEVETRNVKHHDEIVKSVDKIRQLLVTTLMLVVVGFITNGALQTCDFNGTVIGEGNSKYETHDQSEDAQVHQEVAGTGREMAVPLPQDFGGSTQVFGEAGYTSTQGASQ